MEPLPTPNQSPLRIKTIIAIVVFLCFVNLAFSQQAVLFDETFDNNNNNWKLRSDSHFLVKIDGGVLHLQKYQRNRENNGCLWLSKEIPRFNTSSDLL